MLCFAFSDGQSFETPLDGSDALVRGSKVPTGVTIAIRKKDDRELVIAKKYQGRVTSEGSMIVSKDGHALTEQFWNPAQSGNKAVMVYTKK
jgi:hypothetical protein